MGCNAATFVQNTPLTETLQLSENVNLLPPCTTAQVKEEWLATRCKSLTAVLCTRHRCLTPYGFILWSGFATIYVTLRRIHAALLWNHLDLRLFFRIIIQFLTHQRGLHCKSSTSNKTKNPQYLLHKRSEIVLHYFEMLWTRNAVLSKIPLVG